MYDKNENSSCINFLNTFNEQRNIFFNVHLRVTIASRAYLQPRKM